MATITIGLNNTSGNNRIRFETLSERLQKVNIDILHQASTVGSLQTTQVAPDSGELGCFFLDEIEQCKKLETSRHFRKFYFETSNLVQSLPELIHHQNKVVALLTRQISNVSVQDLPSYFRLASVLARDLKEDLQPHFHLLMQTLQGVVGKVAYSSLTVGGPVSANPELTGQLFECMSHLLRSQWDTLSQDPDSLRQYYGPLLGNSTNFVRDFAAKSFVLVIRKCSSKVFKAHMKKVIFALASNSKTFLGAAAGTGKQELLHSDPLEMTVQERVALQGKSLAHKDKRVSELFEGVSLTMFYTAKGVKGRLHSKAIERLRVLWNIMFPLSSAAVESIASELTKTGSTGASKSSSKKGKEPTGSKTGPVKFAQLSTESQATLQGMAKEDAAWKVYSCGKVISFAVWRLFRHITPSHLPELWSFLLEMVGDAVRALRTLRDISEAPVEVARNIEIAMSFLVEMLYFGVQHSNGRGVSHKAVKNSVGDEIIVAGMNISELVLTEHSGFSDSLVRRARVLFCQVWRQFPQNIALVQRIDRVLKGALPALSPEPAVAVFARELLPVLPYGVVQRHLLQPMLAVIARLSLASSEGSSSAGVSDAWLGTLLEVITKIHDARENFSDFAGQCATPAYDADKHATGSSAFPKKGDQDEDSWNASESDGSDSEAESAGPEDASGSDSDESVDGDEGAEEEKQVYAASSKNALAALLQNSENIAALAHKCLALVKTSTAALVSAETKPSGKTPKKSKKVTQGEEEPTATSPAQVAPGTAILAAKCLNWFLQSIPQVLLDKSIAEESLSGICSIVSTVLVDSSRAASLATLGLPLASELIALFGRALELDTVQSKGSPSVKEVVRAAVLLLQSHSASVSLSWAVQSLLTRLSGRLLLGPGAASSSCAHALQICLDQEERAQLLDVMSTALASPSYWLRYNWLRILSHLPPAALAEPEADVVGAKNSSQNQPMEVDIARLCLEAMCLSPNIRHEREYSRRIGVLEVHIRGGRMAAEYMRVVCGFCLGLLHFKFKPIWEPAVLVLVSAAKLSEGEATMWPLLLKAIEATTEARNDGPSATAFVADGRDPDTALPERRPLHEYLPQLEKVDSGATQIPGEVVSSELFHYQAAHSAAQLVEPDARTDFETVSSTVWNILKRSPNITLKRSKIVVAIFLTFLSKQYYRGFSEDPELPYLRQVGLFSVVDADQQASSASEVVFPAKILKKRLEMFLQVFAAVTSPKQLYCHQLLYTFYQEIMAKADVNTVKLAFDCILTYKPAALVPYKDSVKRLLDDKTIRDELVNLDATKETKDAEAEPFIKENHRAELVPLLIRVVYGRFTSKARGSKAARDQNIARRAAVLAFISKMDAAEMRHLLQLMLRGIIPVNKEILPASKASNPATAVSISSAEWYDAVDRTVQSMSASQLDDIAWERQIGFLHLMQPIIRILGFGITSYVPLLHKLVLTMLNHAQEIRARSTEAGVVEVAREYDDEEDGAEGQQRQEEDAQSRRRRDETQALRVRSLCLLRIAEMIDQYHAVHNFMTNSESFFTPLQPLILALPTAVSSCRANCPAILRIFHSLSQYEQTITVLAERTEVVCTIIRCIASPNAAPEVMRYVIDILHALLDWKEGYAIFPHSELIIASFSKRFVGPSYEETAELKLSEMDVTPTGSIKTELKLLCRIASGVFQRAEIKINSVLVGNLAILLLGMLRTYTTSRRIRVEEDWVIDILKIYQTLLFRISDVTNQIAFISRLFGPATHSFSLFNVSSVRQQLVQVLGGLSAHPSTLGLLTRSHHAVEEITSEDPSLIGSRDFTRFMPVLQSLSRDGRRKAHPETSATVELTWSAVLGPDLASTTVAPAPKPVSKKGKAEKVPAPVDLASKAGARNAALYSAVLYEIIRCMYDAELVVRTAALAALKRLVSDIAEWSGCIPSTDLTVPVDATWLDLLRSILIPAVRRGFKQSTDIIKRGFILLFAHIARVIGTSAVGAEDEVFHADVVTLLHEDPEQDFFENIVHIQSHRRVRALTKLRAALAASAPAIGEATTATDAQGKKNLVLTASTFNHVLLPLAYHFLFSDEFQKKDHQPLMQEAALFVGTVGSHLRWNHYLSTMKTVLKQLEKGKAEKEKTLLNALCAILDAFHFNLTGKQAAVLKALPDRQGLIDMMALPEPEKRDKGKKSAPAALPASSKAADEDSSDDEAETAKKEEDLEEDDGVESDDDERDPATAQDAREAEELPEEAAPEAMAVDEKEDLSYISIAQTLVNSVLPWVQVFLLKNGKDHKGNATRTVQPHVALALTKLIQRLEEPVVTAHYKHNLFVNLVIRVVSTLKSHDTTGRDVARDCLAKMIITLGLSSLKAVLYELQFALKEGFQRHVCNYTVRTILRMVLVNYVPPKSAPSVPLQMLDQLDKISIETVIPPFDTAIPLIMQSALDDLAGGAQDDREADEALRSLIREAKGSKANDTLELTARSLLFRPTYALLALEDPASLSSIHALTIPLLNSLQAHAYDKSNNALVGRIAEALQRVALGLSRNPSLEAKELLLYLHSTLQPFVGAIARDLARHREAIGRITSAGFKRKADEADADAEALDNEALDETLPSYLREESSDEDERALYSSKVARGGRGDDVTGYRAATWLPSDRRSLQEQRAVLEARNRESRARIEVQDGASAPKLTGRNKYTKGATAKTGFNAAGGTGGDRSTLVAIKYCLTLLYACLKQNKLDSRNAEVQAMAVPFLPLLGKCLQLPAASSVVSLAVRCMTTLIGWGIPVEGKFLTALGNRLMKLIFKGGGLVSTETELAQACTKGLSSLFKIYNAKVAEYDAAKAAKKRTSLGGKAKDSTEASAENDPLKPVMPIAAENLRSLVQLLTVSIMEVTSTFQTAAFQLVREIVATRVLIPEIYDLVTKLAEQIVLSQRKGVRESASSIVVTFLVSYPLGEKRVASQLKQLINNCEFEFEEGRTAALKALVMLIKAMPAPVLEDYAQMLFLPATLRVVNDKAAHCREQAAAVIVALVRKVSSETVLQFQEYVLKWLSSARLTTGSASGAAALLDTQTKSLIRTGSQIAGLIVKGRPDMCKRDNHIAKLIHSVHFYMQALLEHSTGRDLSRNGSSIGMREMAKFEEGQGELGRADSCWGLIYHLVCLCEQLLLHLPAAADYAITHLPSTGASAPVPLMELMQESLLFPHAWVRNVSVRVLALYLKRRDVSRARLSTSADGAEVLTAPNGLYQLARRLCVVVNQTSMNMSMLDSVVACTVFVVRAMVRNPDLNQVSPDLLKEGKKTRKEKGSGEEEGDNEDESEGDSDGDDSDDEEDEEEEAELLGAEDAAGEELAQAAINRAIDGDDSGDESQDAEESDAEHASEDEAEAGQKTGKRKASASKEASTSVKRANVVIAAEVDVPREDSGPVSAAALGCGGAHWVMQRLRGIGADSRGSRRLHVIKVFLALVQAESAEFVTAYLAQIVDVAVRATLAVNTTPDAAQSPVQLAKELAAELLERLEQAVGSAAFIGAYSEVQRRVQSSKAEKRRQFAAEAIAEPAQYAQRKIAQAQKKKDTKKRQTLRGAAIRGLKRKSSNSAAVY